MLLRALEKQDEALGVCVWTRIGVLTLRGCGGFILEGGGLVRAHPGEQLVSGRYLDGRERQGMVHFTRSRAYSPLILT